MHWLDFILYKSITTMYLWNCIEMFDYLGDHFDETVRESQGWWFEES